MKLKSCPAVTVCAAIGSSVGCWLTSPTVTVSVSRSLRFGLPLSVTTTSKVNVPGPWDSVGVHANAPVVGLIDAPAGICPLVPLARLKVSICPASGSLAVAVNVSNWPSSMLWLPMELRTGASFAELIVTRTESTLTENVPAPPMAPAVLTVPPLVPLVWSQALKSKPKKSLPVIFGTFGWA